MNDFADWLKIGLGALITFVGTVVVAALARQSSKESNAITFSASLIQRIEKLETSNEKLSEANRETQDKLERLNSAFASLKTTLSVSIYFIEKLIINWGNPVRPPIPDKLKGHIDPRVWDSWHRSGPDRSPLPPYDETQSGE